MPNPSCLPESLRDPRDPKFPPPVYKRHNSRLLALRCGRRIVGIERRRLRRRGLSRRRSLATPLLRPPGLFQVRCGSDSSYENTCGLSDKFHPKPVQKSWSKTPVQQLPLPFHPLNDSHVPQSSLFSSYLFSLNLKFLPK